MPDYPGAIEMYVDRQRVFIGNNDHTWLVLHKTAGFHSAQAVAQFFATDPNEASTHYVVGQDGVIVQCVREVDGAAGNCCLFPGHAPYLPTGTNMNWHTISIEHVDPATDNSTPLTAAQQAASFALIADICKRHNIPTRPGDASGGIIGHRDIDPVNRARCPGNYPWNALFTYLRGDTLMPVPTGWKDDGTTLTAPNGHKVIAGFRGHILSVDAWPANDVPLEEEHHVDVLEEGYQQSPADGQQQLFMYSEFCYNSVRGVYLASVGREMLTIRTQRDALKNQLASLQAQITSLETQLATAQQASDAAQYHSLLAQIHQLSSV